MNLGQAKNQGVKIINKKEIAQANYNDGEYKMGMVATHYDDNINMYGQPPENIISLYEFQQLALDRLQVLKKIEFMYDSNET